MRRSLQALILSAGLLAGVLLLAACQPQPEFTPTPTRTPGGPVGLTDTPTLDVTVTQPAPTVAVATAQPIPEGPYGPDSYPDNINPLTGMPVSDPSVLNRAPLAIKISNDPLARPQSGLTSADVVWEHEAEGGVTRFTAIFYSQYPQYAGSVRSGRLIDLELVPMYGAVYVSSGFSSGVLQRMEAASWVNRNFSSPFGYEQEPYMVRIRREGLAEEHTLFAVPDAISQLATDQGVNNPPNLTPGMLFRAEPPANGAPASQVIFDYSTDLFRAEWDYNPDTGLYERSIAGAPQIDYLNNQQITASNVISLAANHVQTDILEDNYRGLWSLEIQLWGQGPMSLFRDGQRFDGWWSRPNLNGPLQFTDLDGNTMAFRPGNTWFEVVWLGFDRLTVNP